MPSNNSNRKTTFDKVVQVSSAILIPISIALAGHLFGLQMKYAEIESKKQMHRQDWKITKGELISKFVEDLTSSSETKRKIAVEAILIALPNEDGKRIAKKVSKDDPSPEVRESAKNSIVSQIIRRMFNEEDEKERIEATRRAISGWLNSNNFISSLISHSMRNIENENGVWNSIIYLEKNKSTYLSKYEKKIRRLRVRLDSIGGRPKTIKRIDEKIINKIN